MSLATVFSLANNGQFRGLVQAAVAKAAYDITNESGATPNHTERLAWAKTTMKDPEPAMKQMIWMVLQNTTIIASGTNFVENDIQFAVNSNIDYLAL
jgi:hypothetical protein